MKGSSLVLTALLSILMIAGVMYAIPKYNVWQQGLSGAAELAKAEQNRKILVEQAIAEEEAATYRANAIAIVGQAAKDFPEYRMQEFLGAFGEALQSDNIDKIVFIPTEANIPITEAGRTAD